MPTYKIPLTVSVECEDEELDNLVDAILRDISNFGAVVDIYAGVVEEYANAPTTN